MINPFERERVISKTLPHVAGADWPRETLAAVKTWRSFMHGKWNEDVGIICLCRLKPVRDEKTSKQRYLWTQRTDKGLEIYAYADIMGFNHRLTHLDKPQLLGTYLGAGGWMGADAQAMVLCNAVGCEKTATLQVLEKEIALLMQNNRFLLVSYHQETGQISLAEQTIAPL